MRTAVQDSKLTCIPTWYSSICHSCGRHCKLIVSVCTLGLLMLMSTLQIHRCIVDMPSREAFLHRHLRLKGMAEELHAAEADHS